MAPPLRSKRIINPLVSKETYFLHLQSTETTLPMEMQRLLLSQHETVLLHCQAERPQHHLQPFPLEKHLHRWLEGDQMNLHCHSVLRFLGCLWVRQEVRLPVPLLSSRESCRLHYTKPSFHLCLLRDENWRRKRKRTKFPSSQPSQHQMLKNLQPLRGAWLRRCLQDQADHREYRRDLQVQIIWRKKQLDHNSHKEQIRRRKFHQHNPHEDYRLHLLPLGMF